jgi:hypothetical protein
VDMQSGPGTGTCHFINRELPTCATNQFISRLHRTLHHEQQNLPDEKIEQQELHDTGFQNNGTIMIMSIDHLRVQNTEPTNSQHVK